MLSRFAKLIATAASLLLLSQQAFANQNGSWYSGFEADISSIQLSIHFDQRGASSTGAATIFFGQKAAGFDCPPEAHPEFCDELQERIARNDRSAFDHQVLGVLYEGEAEAFVAFGFSDEETVRLLAVNRNAQNGPAIRMYHPVRGIDAQVGANQGKHFCENNQCSSDRLDGLLEDERRATGFFSDRSFLRTFDPTRDMRAFAHAQRRSSSNASNGFGIYESVGQYMTASWQVRNRNGEALGEVRLFGTGTKYWGGRGSLDEPIYFKTRSEVQLDENGRTEDFVNFEVTFFADGSGERVYGTLYLNLPESPSDAIFGVLEQGGLKSPVLLSRLGTYEGEVEGDATVPALTELTFALRNIPDGRSLVVRQLPDRASKPVGTLSGQSTGLRIAQCVPSINQTQFDEASLDGKLELLGGVWCEVAASDPAIPQGFVLGRYLRPLL